MTLHKEGYTSIFLTFLFVLAMAAIVKIIWPVDSVWHYIFYGLLLVFFLIIVQFFRSPARVTNAVENYIISPADGKVVVVEQTTETECLLDERIQISIFMSPVNVHVNRYPVSGTISYYNYHPGKYLMAWNPKSSIENERSTIVIDTLGHGEVLIRQIAGFLARRIVCYATEGNKVQKGSELGFIKFGSRVDIFIPLDAEILVKPGDKVKGGESIIGRFLSEQVTS